MSATNSSSDSVTNGLWGIRIKIEALDVIPEEFRYFKFSEIFSFATLAWKHSYSLRNITLTFETSFCHLERSLLSLEISILAWKLVNYIGNKIMFPSEFLCSQLDICFPANNRNSKLLIFCIYVSKILITREY